MNILVTGGAGFIGSNYVNYVLGKQKNKETNIIVVDKLTYSGSLENLNEVLNHPNFEFVQGDICDELIIKKLVSKVDRVINFAAESHVDNSIISSREFIKTNILGTQVILDAIKEKPEVKFLQVSTDEVYGSINSGSWDESYPLMPNSPYAASKAAADLLVRAYHQTFSLDVMISRCCNNYGPKQYPEKIIPLFITNLITNKQIPIYGTGENIREWIHVTDHCRGLELILDFGKSGEIYNLGSEIELTNKEVAINLLEFFNFDIGKINYITDRLGHDKRYSLNFKKAMNQLGFKPEVSFSDGIKNTIEWYIANRDWWESKIKA
jgi:dTDP-glucose 4,6-dehydratase